MKRYSCIFRWMLPVMMAPLASPGQGETPFTVVVFDNTGVRHAGNTYTVTSDSVTLSGLADYGRIMVDYLRRPLSSREKKKTAAFLNKFQFDALEDTYTGDTAGVFTGEHGAPRTVEISGRMGNRSFYSKMTGCYARKIVRFCEFMNDLFPEEAAIRIQKEDFKVRFP